MAKIPQARRLLLQRRAEQLFREGNDENTAAAIMVTEQLCSAPIAHGIVKWVIAHGGKAPSPRPKRKKRNE